MGYCLCRIDSVMMYCGCSMVNCIGVESVGTIKWVCIPVIQGWTMYTGMIWVCTPVYRDGLCYMGMCVIPVCRDGLCYSEVWQENMWEWGCSGQCPHCTGQGLL